MLSRSMLSRDKMENCGYFTPGLVTIVFIHRSALYAGIRCMVIIVHPKTSRFKYHRVITRHIILVQVYDIDQTSATSDHPSRWWRKCNIYVCIDTFSPTKLRELYSNPSVRRTLISLFS